MTNQTFHSHQSEITNPGEYQFLFENLPDDISELHKVIQGIMVHIHWAETYGVLVTKERRAEENLRKIERQLSLIAERAPPSKPIQLPLQQRILGTCRDFSTVLCSMLRHQQIPARPRCGFATYFGSSKKYDHWICEYWDSNSNRWKMADAQLDDFQCETVNIAFDVTDIPREKFLLAGKAWQLCREKRADPNEFGIMDWFGMWFIKGNLVRDLLSLSKVEVLPWDINEMTGPYKNHCIDERHFPLLDSIAKLTSDSDCHFSDINDITKTNPILCMPGDWRP